MKLINVFYHGAYIKFAFNLNRIIFHGNNIIQIGSVYLPDNLVHIIIKQLSKYYTEIIGSVAMAMLIVIIDINLNSLHRYEDK